MRLKLLIVTSLCLTLPYEKAITWTPCMPFCDTMCTGTAAISLSTTVAGQYSSFITKTAQNGQKIVSLSSSFLEQQANLYSDDSLASQKRISAYDGVAKSIVFTLEKSIATKEKLTDHIVQEVANMKKSLSIAKLASENTKQSAILSLDQLNETLVATPQVADGIVNHKKRYKEAVSYQLQMSQKIEQDSASVQLHSLLQSIDFDLPNPFTVSSIEEADWENFQKLLTVTYNNKSYIENRTFLDKQRYLKKQIALSIIAKIFSEMVEVPHEHSTDIVKLTGAPSVNINEVLYKQFKRQMLNVQTQTITKSAPINSLLIIHNLQLAQKNLLLSEIKNTKELKNSLLAISSI